MSEGELTRLEAMYAEAERRVETGGWEVSSHLAEEVVNALPALIAALRAERKRADEAEAWCQRLADDREMESGLREAERGRVLHVLLEEFSVGDVAYLRERLGLPESSRAMPHEATRRRLARLEGAARRLTAQGGGETTLVGVRAADLEALREALEGDGGGEKGG